MKSKLKNICLAIIYFLTLLFFMFKMFYYSSEVGGFPDEDCHIGYVIYLETSNEIIPDFNEMPLYKACGQQGDYTIYQPLENTHNYLGHPPLYYHIIRLSNCVKVSDSGDILVNLHGMRKFNILIMSFTMAAIFMIGYTRIKTHTDKILPHAVFSVAAVSVPMLAYVCGGINNDNLVLVGVTVFMAGVLRYFEDDKGILTYCIVGIGFMIACLSKLTAGEMLGFALLVILIMDYIRNKNLKLIINPKFAATLILYLLPVIYLLILHVRFGTIQPTLKSIDFEYYMSTGFYVPIERRSVVAFIDYFKYFWPHLLNTWVILYGHTIWIGKYNTSVEALGFIILLCVFVVYTLLCMDKKRKYDACFAGIMVGVLVTAFSQYINGYNSYIENGYMGGYQARYYLAVIPFFALANALFLTELEGGMIAERKWMKRILVVAELAYIYLLIYGDFVYFLLNDTLRKF